MKHQLPILLLQPLVSIIPPSVSITRTTLSTLCKWNQTISILSVAGLFHLASKVQPCCSTCQNALPFLRLNNTPLCVIDHTLSLYFFTEKKFHLTQRVVKRTYNYPTQKLCNKFFPYSPRACLAVSPLTTS